MQIGAQLYTIRNYTQNERDFGRAMEKVAAIGYKTVQLSAIGPIDPKKVKSICDQNGLKIVLTHSDVEKDLDKTLETHAIYDCKYIGIGGMPEKYRNEGWLPYFAEDFGPIAEKMKQNGFKLMYHNHAFEFIHFSDGRPLMDHLLEIMPADLMGVTADTYWLQLGGNDVNEWLKAHADRLHCVHLKDLQPTPDHKEYRMAALGTGNINFPAILDTISKNGVTEYALVEQDLCYGEFQLDCLKKSFEHLKKLGY